MGERRGSGVDIRCTVCALEPGEKLPSIRAMAVDLAINPNTIQRAYAELEAEGFIYSVPGMVAPSRAVKPSKVLTTFFTSIIVPPRFRPSAR